MWGLKSQEVPGVGGEDSMASDSPSKTICKTMPPNLSLHTKGQASPRTAMTMPWLGSELVVWECVGIDTPQAHHTPVSQRTSGCTLYPS